MVRSESELARGHERGVYYQYLANLHYLRKDIEGARVALRRAVELDPDNLINRSNLRALEAIPQSP